MEDFKKQVYELAFGQDAHLKGYTDEEVLKALTTHVQEYPKFLEYVDKKLKPKGNPMDESEENFQFRVDVEGMILDFESEEGMLL